MKRKSILIFFLVALVLFTGFFGCERTEEAPFYPAESTQTQSFNKEEKEDAFSENTGKESPEQEALSEETEEAEKNIGGIKPEEKDPTFEIPPYSGEIFVVLNDNMPSFSRQELTENAYESYSSLDALGRTGVALASCGKEIMPAKGEKRGSISSIRPSGWVQAKYDIVSGKYLYNRCHLIGWQLSAENANPKNLITGTRYFNTEGMLLFENMIADYIKETGNHVAYRVSPFYEGDDLVAKGVRMEAFSVEDQGEGICFHVFVYNVQPGIVIDYGTGTSILESVFVPATTAKVPTTTTAAPTTTTAPPTSTTQATVPFGGNGDPDHDDTNGEIVYKTPTGKRYHVDPQCGGKNSTQTTLQEALARGLTPCKTCVE